MFKGLNVIKYMFEKFLSNNNKLNNVFKRDSIIVSSILPLLLSLICLFFNNEILLSFQNISVPFMVNIILKFTFALLMSLFAITVLYSIKQIEFYNNGKKNITSEQLDLNQCNYEVFWFFVTFTIRIILIVWLMISVIVLCAYALNLQVSIFFTNYLPYISILILFVLYVLIYIFLKKIKKVKLMEYIKNKFFSQNKYKFVFKISNLFQYFIVYFISLFFAFILIAFKNQKEFKVIFNDKGIINIETNINFKDTDKILCEIINNKGRHLAGVKTASESQISNKNMFKYSMILFRNKNEYDTVTFDNNINKIINYIFNKNSDAEFFYNYNNKLSYTIDLNDEISDLNRIENQKLAIAMIVCVNKHTSIIVNNFCYVNEKYYFANNELHFSIFTGDII